MADIRLLPLKIVVRQMGASQQYRAAVQIAGQSFVSFGRSSAVEAAQQLLRYLGGLVNEGSGSGEPSLALDIALSGYASMDEMIQRELLGAPAGEEE